MSGQESDEDLGRLAISIPLHERDSEIEFDGLQVRRRLRRQLQIFAQVFDRRVVASQMALGDAKRHQGVLMLWIVRDDHGCNLGEALIVVETMGDLQTNRQRFGGRSMLWIATGLEMNESQTAIDGDASFLLSPEKRVGPSEAPLRRERVRIGLRDDFEVSRRELELTLTVVKLSERIAMVDRLRVAR